MAHSASRRPGTSPSFWQKYNKTQDSMIAARMPTLPPSLTPAPRRTGRFGQSTQPNYGATKVYSA